LHTIQIRCIRKARRQSKTNLGTDNFDSSVVEAAWTYHQQIEAGDAKAMCRLRWQPSLPGRAGLSKCSKAAKRRIESDAGIHLVSSSDPVLDALATYPGAMDAQAKYDRDPRKQLLREAVRRQLALSEMVACEVIDNFFFFND
jgi:hypothetical protein